MISLILCLMRSSDLRITEAEGVLYRNVIGTYLHGPLLPKNPHVCDLLLQRALSRKYGVSLTDFPALDDSIERKANQAILSRYL